MYMYVYQLCHVVCVGLQEVQENQYTYTSQTCQSRLQMLYMYMLVYMFTTKIHVYNKKYMKVISHNVVCVCVL